MAAFLLLVLLLSLTGCGKAGPGAADPSLSYLVSVTAGESSGCGILYQWDERFLYVLTAAHVVSGQEPGGQAVLRFFDGREIRCGEISSSGTADLALLRIPRDHIPSGHPYQCAVSDKESFDRLQAGDSCAAVGLNGDGEALRYEGSILEPWIYMEDYGQYMIWADAGIEPGMSGGALLDKEGRLIGLLSGGSEDGELAAVPFSLILQFMLELPQ